VRIWEVSYYLVDEEGDDIVDENGEVRIFSDNGDIDVSTWAEGVEPDDLIETEKSRSLNNYEILKRKVAHGCTDAFCEDCDNE